MQGRISRIDLENLFDALLPQEDKEKDSQALAVVRADIIFLLTTLHITPLNNNRINNLKNRLKAHLDIDPVFKSRCDVNFVNFFISDLENNREHLKICFTTEEAETLKEKLQRMEEHCPGCMDKTTYQRVLRACKKQEGKKRNPIVFASHLIIAQINKTARKAHNLILGGDYLNGIEKYQKARNLIGKLSEPYRKRNNVPCFWNITITMSNCLIRLALHSYCNNNITETQEYLELALNNLGSVPDTNRSTFYLAAERDCRILQGILLLTCVTEPLKEQRAALSTATGYNCYLNLIKDITKFSNGMIEAKCYSLSLPLYKMALKHYSVLVTVDNSETIRDYGGLFITGLYQSYFYQGRLKYDENYYEEALAHYKTVIKYVELLHHMSNTDAIKLFKNNSRIFRDMTYEEVANIYYMYATAAEEAGDPAAAQKHFLKAQKYLRKINDPREDILDQINQLSDRLLPYESGNLNSSPQP